MAAEPAGPAMEAAGVPYEDIDDLALRFIGIWNPQHVVRAPEGPEPGEAALLRAVCSWLSARQIPHERDLAWGVHAELVSPGGGPEKPGILLTAHLDSDVLAEDSKVMESIVLDREKRELTFNGEVGLDDKSGVAIALSVIERFRTGRVEGLPPQWRLHVLFTVGEESGQKGAFWAPIQRLLAGRVRYGIVIDRQTNGSGAPTVRRKCVRHVVNMYKGVPLLDPRCEQEMMRLLGRGLQFAGEQEHAAPPPAVESPNCADALELRGRWDAEVLAPRLLAQGQGGEQQLLELRFALVKYEHVSRDIRKKLERLPPEERVSGMYSPPRITRYEAMRKVYKLLHGKGNFDIDPSLWFSCVNLSYDYSEWEQSCSIAELERTANALVGFVAAYFEGA